MDQPNKIVDSARIGVIILTGFSLVWIIAALTLSSLPLSITLATAVIVGIGAVIVLAFAASTRFAAVDETTTPMEPARRRKIFISTNIVQAILFSVLISVCIALNQLAYIPLIGSIIVGAHLISIGLSFAEQTFVIGGGLMVVTGIAGTIASVTALTTPSFATGAVSLINAIVLVGLAGLQIHIYGKQPQQE